MTKALPAAPAGWRVMKESGVNAYYKMERGTRGPVQLRVKEMGMRHDRKFAAYYGASYIGSHSTLNDALLALSARKAALK